MRSRACAEQNEALLTAQRLAGKLNEMMGNEAHAKDRVDLAAVQRLPRRIGLLDGVAAPTR